MMYRERHKLMRAQYTLHKIRRAIHPADFPARHAEQLPGATHSNCVFKHTWERGNGNMLRRRKDQVLIHFIGNHRHIMFDAKLGDHGQFLASKDTPTWVMWRVQNERARFLAKGRA